MSAEISQKVKRNCEEVIKFHGLTPRPQKKKNEFDKIYTLPVIQTFRDEENKIRICQHGYHKKGATEAFIIMVVGPTGTGKSTTINALVNYLLYVQYDDNYRFELVDLERDEMQTVGNQALSQTQWITVYEISKIKDSPVERSIFIVDTPGLDDTRGREQDEQTVRQIKLLFERHLSVIHAVCITLNGNEARLKQNQRYIFDSITKIFGKDIVNNLYIWATFTDFPNPPIKACLEEYKIEYEKLFTIENGALYEKVPENEKDMKKSKSKFEDVHETFDEFFNEFLIHKAPVSLENTKIVIRNRDEIISLKQSIENKLTKLIKHIEEKEKLKSQLQQEMDKVEQDCVISFDVTILHHDKNREKKVNNCSHCKRTCCNPCSHTVLTRHKCAKMTNDGYCKVCRCFLRFHERSQTERYEVENKSLVEIDEIQRWKKDSIIIDEVTERDIKDVKALLNKSMTDITQTNEFISKLDKDITLIWQKIQIRVKNLHLNISKLKELALYQENPSLLDIICEIKMNDEKHEETARSVWYEKLENYATNLINKK